MTTNLSQHKIYGIEGSEEWVPYPDPNVAVAQAAVDALEALNGGGTWNFQSTVPIGGVAYTSLGTDSFGVATETYVCGLYLMEGLVTSLAYLKGSVVGTDKVCLALWGSTGVVLGQTPAAGTTVSAGENTFQKIGLDTPFTALRGQHYLGLQINGTTAKIRLMADLTYLNFTKKLTAGTFGVFPALTPPTGFVATAGPIGYVT